MRREGDSQGKGVRVEGELRGAGERAPGTRLESLGSSWLCALGQGTAPL